MAAHGHDFKITQSAKDWVGRSIPRFEDAALLTNPRNSCTPIETYRVAETP